MLNSSRLQLTAKNAIIGIIGQLFTYTLQFITRTIFINLLGPVYLGLNGLFSNILSVLSIAELGVGYAITFSLYKPLADKNISKIQALMYFYKKAYNFIGILILVMGIALMPFLNYLIIDKPDIPNLNLIFLLFLMNTVSTYFFSYKRSIIIADQRNYIVTINTNIFALLTNVAQIIILIVYNNFILYLLVQILFTIISNIALSIKADKLFPYLKGKKLVLLDEDSKKDIIKKIRAMAFHQIGGVAVLGTDNILISYFIGIYTVGIYSNYLMLINFVNAFINQVINSVTASIGNLIATENIEKNIDVFYKLLFGTFIIYGFSSTLLFTLINPFITLWIGSNFILPKNVVLVIVLNFYLKGMRNSVTAYRNALGLFYQDRYKPIFEAIINLVASIALLKIYGLLGVFLGTLISTVTTNLWVEPFVLYKYYFKKPLSVYFKKYFIYLIITVCLAISAHFISVLIFSNTWFSFIIIFLLTIALFLTIFIAIFYRTDQFKYYYALIREIFKKVKSTHFNLSKNRFVP